MTTEKVTEYLKETLGEDIFTPDFIDGLKGLELDAPPEGAEKQQEAIDKAIEENNKEWEARYRETFFGGNKHVAKEQEASDPEPLPDAVEEETPAEDEITLADIFTTTDGE